MAAQLLCEEDDEDSEQPHWLELWALEGEAVEAVEVEVVVVASQALLRP